MKNHFYLLQILLEMGIDKPNIRNTIHLEYLVLEGFYQEAGRAGRDNQPANCVLLTYKPEDIYEPYIYRFIKQDTNVNELTKIYEFIKWKIDLSTNFSFSWMKSMIRKLKQKMRTSSI